MRNPEGYSPRWWRQHPEVRPPSGVGSSENTKLDKLERSTVETYVSLVVAIVTVVFPVTWYIRVLLLCLLACIVGDLTWRSPWTVELSERLKMVICGIFVLALLLLGWNPLYKQYKLETAINTEPAERAALRVISVQGTLEHSGYGQIDVYVANVGRYEALSTSVVFGTVITSPPLDRDAENRLFYAAPLSKEREENGKTSSARWQNLIEMHNWYPSDVPKVLHLDSLGIADPQDWGKFDSGDRGWYVLTRAGFKDKLGVLPVVDSCWYFSLTKRKGFKCVDHND